MAQVLPLEVTRVADVIQADMDRLGISLSKLSEATGVPKSTLHRHLRGITAFDLRELHLIAFELGRDLPGLFEAAEAAA